MREQKTFFQAILGGICVDTRELLGPPLTEHIDTFLSVAGTNNGALPCLVPIPVGTCNKKNGLHCESSCQLMEEIQSQMKQNYLEVNALQIQYSLDELQNDDQIQQ